MLSADIADFWRLWRVDRTRILQTAGMTKAAALRFTEREVTGRIRLAETIGIKAASTAELGVTRDSNGVDRWYVIVDPALVPPIMRKAAEEFHFGKTRRN